MKWLITGGCGFIGTSLINRLLSSGDNHQIRVLDNLSTGTRQDLENVCHVVEKSSVDLNDDIKDVELIVEDILDDEVAVQVAQGIDVIIHLAANTGVAPSVADPRTDCYANVIGTLNYLEAARMNKVGKFVFASSGAPVGNAIPPIHEELPAHPVSPYGASKLAGEGYCSAYYHSFNVNTVCLRFGNVYGPGSTHKASVVAKFIRLALAGKILEVYGDGEQSRDFIYIDDLTDVLIRSAQLANIGGEIFQIASNAETTVNEMVLKLSEVLKNSGLKVPQVLNTEKRVGDVTRNYSDTTKARNQLGWKPGTALEEGLQNTVSYFLK